MEGPCTVLGGLRLIAEVWSSQDYWGEWDCGVDALYWIRKDGTKGKEVSQKVYDRIEAHDTYWEAKVTEQVFDGLSSIEEDLTLHQL
jgi:hypothetical protein